jgi:hypothetical protein
MSKSNNRIPFKSSNNKNSPYNMNEIDINLLMSNPKHIHKMMGKEECDDKDDVLPLIDAPKHLRKAGSDMKDNLKFFKETGSGLLKKYMDKDKKKETVKTNIDKPLLWNEKIDLYLKNRLPEEKYEDFKKRWDKEQNKPKAIALNGLLEKEEKFKNEEAKAPAKALKNLIKNTLYDKR